MALATKTRTRTAAPAGDAPQFAYQNMPELAAARARLAQLNAELTQAGSKASELRENFQTTQAGLLAAQTEAAMGKRADVDGARAAFEQARDALAAYSPTGGVLKSERDRVARMVDRLERQERQANKPVLQAAAKPIITEMLSGLRAAAAADAKLRALRQAAGGDWPGSLARECLPATWDELNTVQVGSAIGRSKLEGFERTCRALGLLD
jgi:hypothetical protein